MKRLRSIALVAAAVCGAGFVVASSEPARAQSVSATKPDVLFVPTPQPVVEAMLEAAGVKAGDVVYDLGSGDGRIVITAAKKFGARGVGIDIDPAMVKAASAE